MVINTLNNVAVFVKNRHCIFTLIPSEIYQLSDTGAMFFKGLSGSLIIALHEYMGRVPAPYK